MSSATALALVPNNLKTAGALKLPEVAPAGVTKEAAWATMLAFWNKNDKIERKAKKESGEMDRFVTGVAGALAGGAAVLGLTLAIEYWPGMAKIGPGKFKIDTEALAAGVGLGGGLIANMFEADYANVFLIGGSMLAGSYLGKKGRQWGAAWKQNGFSFSM